MNEDFKRKVRIKIEYKPRLVPIFSSTHNIPERLNEYNPNLFICHNCVKNRFEVHSLEQTESYCADLPYRSLDERSLRWIWQNDIRVHGDEIFKEIDRHEEGMKKQKDREFRNWVEDVGSETRSMFAKDAWTVGT